MIITALRARNMADSNLNKKDVSFKKQIRQLRKIESAIIRASKKVRKGKKLRMFIEYYDDIYHCVFETLEKNGYKVINRSTHEYYCFIISWQETKWK